MSGIGRKVARQGLEECLLAKYLKDPDGEITHSAECLSRSLPWRLKPQMIQFKQFILAGQLRAVYLSNPAPLEYCLALDKSALQWHLVLKPPWVLARIQILGLPLLKYLDSWV